MELVYNIEEPAFRNAVLASVTDAMVEGKTPKQFLRTLSAKERRAFPEMFLKVLTKSSQKNMYNFFGWAIELMPTDKLRDYINQWYTAGWFSGGYLDDLPRVKKDKVPLQYIDGGPFPKLWEKRKHFSGTPEYAPEKIEKFRKLYLEVIPSIYNANRQNDKNFWVNQYNADPNTIFKLEVGDGTDFTKSLDTVWQRILALPSQVPPGIVLCNRPDQSGFDLTCDGEEWEDKKGTRNPCSPKASYEVIQGNKFSMTKVPKHVLTIYHCNGEGFIEAAWGCLVEVKEGDFTYNKNDNNARSHMAFTWEIVTRPSFFPLFGEIKVEECANSKRGNLKSYPTLIPAPIKIT